MLGWFKKNAGETVSRLSGRSDLLEAGAAVGVYVGAAEGGFSDDEAKELLTQLQNHEVIGKAFSATDIAKAVDKQGARGGSFSGRAQLLKEIEDIAGSDDTEKLLVGLIGLDVAASDGDVSDKERAAIVKIGQILGVDLITHLG